MKILIALLITVPLLGCHVSVGDPFGWADTQVKRVTEPGTPYQPSGHRLQLGP